VLLVALYVPYFLYFSLIPMTKMPTLPSVKVTLLIDKMKRELDALEHDASKADVGQKAASRRVRKVMQSIKTQAQDVRTPSSKPYLGRSYRA
jgi:hypothetical protein